MKSKEKGSIAELAVAADLVRRGYHVAFPFGDVDTYDLLFHREEVANVDRLGWQPSRQKRLLFERVQVKYTKSDGKVIQVKARSHSVTAGQVSSTRTYGPNEAEWVAVYDATTATCYYIHTLDLSAYPSGTIHLRLAPSENNQKQGVRWASDYLGL